jgi:PAS domain S-box-containing protein
MKSLREKKYVNTSFAIALLILLFINYLTYKNTSEHFEDETYVSQTLITIQTAENLMGLLTESETSRRGYLITSNDEFLIQYHSAVDKVDSVYNALKNITLDNAKQQQLLDTLAPLILNRRDILEESLELQERGSIKGLKEQASYTEKGKIMQDKIKSIIDQIEKEDNLDLKKRNIILSESSSDTLMLQGAGIIISFILLITGITLLNRDITHRKAHEKVIEESRNWFSTTLSSIGDAVIATDEMGDITFMNSVAENLTGWKLEEARGTYCESVFNIMNEETRQKLENPVLKVFNKGKVVGLANHTLLVNKQGNEIPIDDSAAPIISRNGSLLGIVLVFRDITARRKAELELFEREKFIQKIADSIPNILYVYELETPSITYVNNKVIEMLGYTPADVKRTGSAFFSTFIHPTDYRRMLSLFQKFASAKDNEVIEYEYRIKNLKGEWRWMRSFDVVFKKNEEGRTVQMMGTALDVTEKKRLEEELEKYSGHLEELVERRTWEMKTTNEKLQKEIIERIKAEKSIASAEEKFRSLVEYSLVGIYIIQNGKYVYANPKLEEIFGYSRMELIGRDVLDLIDEEDRDMVIDNIQKRLNKEIHTIQYSFKGIKKDRTRILVEVRGTKMEYNGELAIIGTLHDITEQKRSEEALKNQQQYLRTIIDVNPNFVFAKDWNGKFTLVNQAVADAYGTTVDNLIGKTDADFNPNKEEVEHFLKDDHEVMSSMISKFIPEETVYNAGKGETVWYQTIKVPFITYDGNKQVLGVSNDITARKKAEERLIKSLKEKDTLLQEIHHRVKNNLQIIVSLLKLQSKFIYDERDLDIFNKSRSRVETMSLIHEKLYRSADLTKIDMMNYLKDLTVHLLQVYNITPGDVNISINAEGINLGIDTAIPCGLIINELISNSLKHAFRIGQKGNISINLCKEDSIIKLFVSDDGMGLSKDFDVSHSDTLGLKLVETLIKQLDGTFEVVSKKGCKYSFEFKELKYRERI